MKDHLKSAFSAHFAMVFMAFIVFSTNTFTLKHPVINVIASILLIGIYLILFYSDAFKNTSVHIRNNKPTVPPFFASVILYIIPILLLVWCHVSPMEYDILVSEQPVSVSETAAETQNTSKKPAEEPVYKKGIRQQAWFELYMQPYKGVYRLTGNNIIIKIISMLLMPFFSMLGYINAKRGVDIMKKAEEKFRKLIYRNEDDF